MCSGCKEDERKLSERDREDSRRAESCTFHQLLVFSVCWRTPEWPKYFNRWIALH